MAVIASGVAAWQSRAENEGRAARNLDCRGAPLLTMTIKGLQLKFISHWF